MHKSLQYLLSATYLAADVELRYVGAATSCDVSQNLNLLQRRQRLDFKRKWQAESMDSDSEDNSSILNLISKILHEEMYEDVLQTVIKGIPSDKWKEDSYVLDVIKIIFQDEYNRCMSICTNEQIIGSESDIDASMIEKSFIDIMRFSVTGNNFDDTQKLEEALDQIYWIYQLYDTTGDNAFESFIIKVSGDHYKKVLNYLND